MKNIYALFGKLAASTVALPSTSASTVAETYTQKSRTFRAAAVVFGLVFAAAAIDRFQLAIPTARADSLLAGFPNIDESALSWFRRSNMPISGDNHNLAHFYYWQVILGHKPSYANIEGSRAKRNYDANPTAGAKDYDWGPRGRTTFIYKGQVKFYGTGDR
jgi:hypothetical protein